jgi:hypothetical protein
MFAFRSDTLDDRLHILWNPYWHIQHEHYKVRISNIQICVWERKAVVGIETEHGEINEERGRRVN